MSTQTKQTIEFKAHHVRNPEKAKSDDWQQTADRWLVSINGVEFDYYTGIGHRVAKNSSRVNGYSFAELKHKTLTDSGVKTFCYLSKPVPPSLDDVLSCLVSDASAAECSFDDWCSDFGYDADSMKAHNIYLECQKVAGELRKARIDIAAERERLADY